MSNRWYNVATKPPKPGVRVLVWVHGKAIHARYVTESGGAHLWKPDSEDAVITATLWRQDVAGPRRRST